MKYYKHLTNEEARAWLIKHDKEAANYWRDVVSDDLVEAVGDNLCSFGDAGADFDSSSGLSYLPIYGETLPGDLKTGLYLGLLHGRDAADEALSGWGFNGPVIGPLNYVHTTYGSELKLEFVDKEDHARYFRDAHSEVVEVSCDGLLKYNDKFYGDWTVFYHQGD